MDEWEASTVSTSFLDTELLRLPNSTRLLHKPRWKLSSLGIPLSTNSFHPAHICRSWTMSELQRLASLSSSEAYFNEAKQVFISRLARFNIEHGIIDRLQQHNPYFACICRHAFSTRIDNSTRKRILPLVMPFHTSFFACDFLAVLAEHFGSSCPWFHTMDFAWAQYQLLGRPMLCWRLSATHLVDLARAISSNT